MACNCYPMTNMIRGILGTVMVCAFIGISAQTIERIEPPFWWRDMHNPKLQLLIYGEKIGETEPRLESDAARIELYHRTPNPNYLFVDIVITPGVEAENLPLSFVRDDGRILSYEYELKQREEDSANRQGFTSADVMYLIAPDRFANGDTGNDVIAGMREGYDREADYGRHGGDIAGMRAQLEYIRDMGFTAIWPMPLLENDQSSSSYHGYSTTDYYKIDPRYGSNDEYAELSKAAAELGLKVIMDVIANHCGSEHWWMTDPPTQDWIHYYEQDFVQTNHRKVTLLDPYVAEEDRDQMVKGWFVKTMPDLNQKNPFMATYLIQNSIWWIEFAHLSGLRQDTYSYPYRDFMTDWTCAIMNEYPHFNIVGEEMVYDPAMVAYWQRGKYNQDGYTSCLPSVMDFPTTSTLHSALNENDSIWGQGLIKLYENLASDYHYADPLNLLIFPDNHDMSRILTQVNENVALTKMAVAYILTMRDIPQLFYGTEILMSNEGTDSHGIIRSDFPGGWPGDTVNGFTGEGLTKEQKDMQDYVRHLLNWRLNHPVIHTGHLKHYSPQGGVYVYFRYDDSERVMVVMNKNESDVDLAMERFGPMLNGYTSATEIVHNNTVTLNSPVRIGARSTTIFTLSQ